MNKKTEGRLGRQRGRDFEKRVRLDLEEEGWIVDKWTNNIKKNKLAPAQNKFLGPNRPMQLGSGFPDFIAFRITDKINSPNCYDVIGVESKMMGKLSKVEKEKCEWYLKRGIFSKILIAYKEKIKNRVYVRYKQFQTKHEKTKANHKV